MKSVPFYDLRITGGFFAERQKTVMQTTVWAVYEQFKATGRIDTMDCRDHGILPHVFWGSDVFKWMEGAAYILESRDDPKLFGALMELVSMIENGVSEDGYYNSHYNSPLCADTRFTNRELHELYSLGHMIEAGVAVAHATGDKRLLNICCRNADLVDSIFRIENSAPFVTPGHEEIELALIRLWQATGEARYLELARYFVRMRGANDKDAQSIDPKRGGEYAQCHLPLAKQTEAVGHSVRAVYLYCAAADLAALGDSEMQNACEQLFRDIYERKLYITGGIGPLSGGEAFSIPYHLPNREAYAETCAALGLALFCRRLYAAKPDGRYGDAAERALFNGMISGLSLSGDAFFYENPLEIDLSRRGIPRAHEAITQRKKVFSCSCCPPNLVRLIPSVGDFIYACDDDYLYVHQYIANEGVIDGSEVALETTYPADGKVHIRFNGGKKLALRRPSWCQTVVADAAYREESGYLYFDASDVHIEFVMEPVFYAASDKVHENAGRTALMRGPIVYCLEGQDQPAPLYRLRVDPAAPVTESGTSLGGYPQLQAQGFAEPERIGLYSPLGAQSAKPCTLTFIPYYAFANRGEDDMQVWIRM